MTEGNPGPWRLIGFLLALAASLSILALAAMWLFILVAAVLVVAVVLSVLDTDANGRSRSAPEYSHRPNSAAGLGEGSRTLQWGPRGWGSYTKGGFFPSG